jgi:DNA-binding Xre family transcriptional regulator
MNIQYTRPMIQWRLKQTLEQHRITRYALQKHTGIAMNTLRDMYDGKTQRPDLHVLDQILTAIQTISSQPIALSDVLEVIELPEPETPEESKHTLEGTGTYELRSTLEQLEKDTPPNELDAWLGAFEQVKL